MAELPLSLVVDQVLGRTPPAPAPPFGAVAAWHLSALDHRPTSWRENQLTILQVLGVIAHACCAGRDTPFFFCAVVQPLKVKELDCLSMINLECSAHGVAR